MTYSSEELRLREQERLDKFRDAGYRNRMGQHATPPGLARDIVRACAVAGRVRFLEPSVGTGAFYSALRDSGAEIERATGVEIDAAFAECARTLWPELEVIHEDFTYLRPRPEYNLVIANPPYVRHHHLNPMQKKRLRATVQESLGVRVNGLAGLYVYFMLLGHAWMSPGATACWLIPSEFMESNYGSVLRDYLTRFVRLKRIHRFAPEDLQFNPLVTSAVVIFENSPPADNLTLTYGGTLDAPDVCEIVATGTLRAMPRWKEGGASGGGKLGDHFRVTRGIATGCNEFFVMTREQARRRKLPPEVLRPILPGPRGIRDAIVESTEELVLDCDNTDDPNVAAYVESGERRNVHDGYLCSRRKPWYSLESREPAPFLCNYMGRGENPFRFYWNKVGALAKNNFLLLYPKVDRDHAELFEALGRIPAADLVACGRVYGGGLHKLEPGELAEVPFSIK